MTLKQNQGHQTWGELVDPKQGYNDKKFKKPHLNSVCEKANKVFVKSGNRSITSLEYVQKPKIMVYHDLLDVLDNPTKFQLNQIRT